jgi:predicted MPP superfamily phosphohydrolase
MNIISRVITGSIMILGGIILIILSFFVSYLFLFYSIPILIIGLFILLNKKEDKIEQIKDLHTSPALGRVKKIKKRK